MLKTLLASALIVSTFSLFAGASAKAEDEKPAPATHHRHHPGHHPRHHDHHHHGHHHHGASHHHKTEKPEPKT